MYAIFEDGGKQYRVEQGATVYLERRDLPDNTDTIEIDQVLMVGNGSASKVGTPHVSGAKVVLRIQGDVKGPKLEIVKFRRRKGYKLHKGHRQKHLKATVEGIHA